VLATVNHRSYPEVRSKTAIPTDSAPCRHRRRIFEPGELGGGSGLELRVRCPLTRHPSVPRQLTISFTFRVPGRCRMRSLIGSSSQRAVRRCSRCDAEAGPPKLWCCPFKV
jgi:hypothetical protein